MKNLSITFLLLFMAAALFPSCVSKKRLRACEATVDQLKNDSAQLHTNLNRSNATIAMLQGEKSTLEIEKSSVESDLEKLAAESEMTIAEQARRLRSLQDLIQSQRAAMNNLKQTVADALIKYKSDELSVYIKNGNVYVSLQEQLLFKSGSAVVDPKGKEALKSLAEVLKNTPNINVMIEGHTDTVPIKTAKFEDNWALSVARATSIVRVLTNDYGVSPNRITASGRSSFFPLSTNETDAGRASNRRTEIILSPDLNELYKLLAE